MRDDARYLVCTVEAMPMQREVAFLAVDEIQLAADHERGHVFTDRLLHARGTEETMFLGSDTIRPILKRLVPEAEVISRPRFSILSYRRRQQAAPPAAAQRRGRVLRGRGLHAGRGAAPPEGRGGGGAGRPVAAHPQRPGRHVPGRRGRASGRHRRHRHGPQHGRGPRRLRRASPSSTAPSSAGCARPRWRRSPAAPAATWPTARFGATNGCEPFEPREIEAIESHSFPPLKALRWRNSELDFASVEALLASLDRAAGAGLPAQGARRGRPSQPRVPVAARRDPGGRGQGPERVRLLWQVCQIPDFRKTLTDAHLHLLATVFRHLTGPKGVLPNDWVGGMIARLERTDGDIDALVARIAHVRTWTYMSHRASWLVDAAHWQERAREVEDRLSDALHERLTQRFVDRRTSALMRSLRESGEHAAVVDKIGRGRRRRSPGRPDRRAEA